MITEQTISLYSAFYVVFNHRVNLLSCFMAENRHGQMAERVKVKHGKEKQKATGADRCPSHGHTSVFTRRTVRVC